MRSASRKSNWNESRIQREILNMCEMNNLINETGRRMIDVGNYSSQAVEIILVVLRPVDVAIKIRQF